MITVTKEEFLVLDGLYESNTLKHAVESYFIDRDNDEIMLFIPDSLYHEMNSPLNTNICIEIGEEGFNELDDLGFIILLNRYRPKHLIDSFIKFDKTKDLDNFKPW